MKPYHMLDQPPAVLPYARPYRRMPAIEYDSTPQKTNVTKAVHTREQIARAQMFSLSERKPIVNPDAHEVAFARVSAREDWAVVSPAPAAKAGQVKIALVN